MCTPLGARTITPSSQSWPSAGIVSDSVLPQPGSRQVRVRRPSSVQVGARTTVHASGYVCAGADRCTAAAVRRALFAPTATASHCARVPVKYTSASASHPANAPLPTAVTAPCSVTRRSPVQPRSRPRGTSVIVAGSTMFCSAVQFSHRRGSTHATSSGSGSSVSAVQPENSPLPSSVMPSGRSMRRSAVQAAKAYAPRLRTPGASVTAVRPVQAENAPVPISVTVPGTASSVSAVQPANA